MKLRVCAILLLLTACSSTPQGQSIDRANYVDMSTTAAALMEGATEANPLMPWIIPVKWGMGRYVDGLPCGDRMTVARVFNGLTYGVSANNVAIMAGASSSVALPIWAAVGIAYWVWADDLEPAVFECEG